MSHRNHANGNPGLERASWLVRAGGAQTWLVLVGAVHHRLGVGWYQSPRPSGERWSRKFGPVVKVDRMTREVIQNEETKEPFARV